MFELIRLRLWVTPVITGVVAVLFLGAWVRHSGGDISHLVVAGDAFVDLESRAPCLSVNLSSGGYDGQFYYRLAVDPFSTAPVLAGVRFDYAVYRSQRIVYPLVAHIFAAGDRCAVLWSLPAVNVLALMLLAWASVRFVDNPRSWYASILVLWPGFLFSLARDLTEPLASALLLVGLVAATRGSWRWAALLLSLAGLTRETTLITAVIVLAYGATKSIVAKRPDILLFVGCLPLVVYIAWKRWLFWWWQLPTNWGAGKVGSIPFTAFATLLRDSYLAGTHIGLVQAIELIAFSLFSCLVILAIPSSKVPRLFKACAIAYFAFVFSLSREIWIEDWAFLRATAEYGVVGGWILSGARPLLQRSAALFFLVSLAALSYEMFAFR